MCGTLTKYLERSVRLKIFSQLFWIFLFSLLGEILSAIISPFIPIPGSVIGLVLLFFALHFNWIEMDKVKEVGTWLTDNMGLFFVPAGVGIMAHFGILANTWWQLLIVIFVTVILMMIFVGRVVQGVKRRNERKVQAKREVNSND